MAFLSHDFSAKINIFALSLACVMSFSGCSKQTEEDLSSSKSIVIHIGFQKYGLLPIVKAQGKLNQLLAKQGIKIKWVEFPAGPQLLEGLNVGSVVFGEAGEAPPIFAQATNPNLIYVANQPPAPKAEALVVPKDSPIRSIQQLKGKRIALNKGSNVHYLLLQLLAKNHLTLKDIQPVYLTPADARAAFEQGAIDAWVIWDPFFAAAEQQLQAKVIATGEGVVSNHQFYLADRNFAKQQPQIINTITKTLDETTQWVSTHPDDAAKLLEQPTGLEFQILKTSISRMGFGVRPLSPQVVKEQQHVADVFYQQQLIPKPIVIKDALLGTQHSP